MTNLVPYGIAWAVLGIVVMALAMKRKQITAHEDDSLHLNAGSGAVSVQVDVAKKLDAIDKWGKLLTILLAASGLVLIVLYGLSVWNSSSNAGF